MERSINVANEHKQQKNQLLGSTVARALGAKGKAKGAPRSMRLNRPAVKMPSQSKNRHKEYR